MIQLDKEGVDTHMVVDLLYTREMGLGTKREVSSNLVSMRLPLWNLFLRINSKPFYLGNNGHHYTFSGSVKTSF